MTVSIPEVHFDERIATLLKESGLPTEDLSAGTEMLLFGCTTNNELRGIVGLELHGSCGLLRSLAVTRAHRGEGIGEALLACAEQAAAPAAIAGTRQFSQLCPASSAFMVKTIADGARIL